MFITIYGINNIGKSTQAKLLVENLNKSGLQAEYLKYPIYDLAPSGPYINHILRETTRQPISEEELQIWYALNRFQFEPQLKAKLAQGITIVAEDYTGTGIAWGMAKGASQNWLENLNAPLAKEDFAILLDGERFIRSKEKQHLHESNDELVKKCRAVHTNLAYEYHWLTVNANQDIRTVAQQIWTMVDSKIKNNS